MVPGGMLIGNECFLRGGGGGGEEAESITVSQRRRRQKVRGATRKSIFAVSDHVVHKPPSTAAYTS